MTVAHIEGVQVPGADGCTPCTVQVLISTSTLAWGVNFPAHLVPWQHRWDEFLLHGFCSDAYEELTSNDASTHISILRHIHKHILYGYDESMRCLP